MGKPEHKVYEQFTEEFYKMNKKIGKEQYLVPYLMSSHPGSTLKEAVELAEYCRDLGYMPEQVQDFYPTPSTLSTCMYYTGVDPCTMKPVYVPKSPHEKAMQRALIQYRNPNCTILYQKHSTGPGRTDLIGFGPKCLIRPRKFADQKKNEREKNSSQKKNPFGMYTERNEVRMRVAIVTGASSGMGREFVLQIGALYKNLDEIWVIARRKGNLERWQSSPVCLCVSLTEIF